MQLCNRKFKISLLIFLFFSLMNFFSLRNFPTIILLSLLSFNAFSKDEKQPDKKGENTISATQKLNILSEKNIFQMYNGLRLEEKGLSQPAFDYAISNYSLLKKKGMLGNDSIITIVDFDQPSYQKRMYIIDIKHSKILFNTWTAHGRNTGKIVARDFSNSPKSLKSSLGTYLTEETYIGKHGYSLRLVGLEKSNSCTYQRAIVVHGADYVSQKMINNTGYIGRSFGCPAVPYELSKPIIDKIKGGSFFFIYNSSYRPSILI